MSFSAELRAAGDRLWAQQHAHPFVRGIADGTLPEARFRHYVRQDHLFLIDYGRTLSYAAARAPRLDWMRRFAVLAHATLGEEMDLHRELAAEWGVSSRRLELEQPTAATRAYCDFLIRTATTGEFAELAAALLPCMWGYAEIGSRLAREPEPGGGHPGYCAWITTYNDPGFQNLASWCRDVCDALGEDAGYPTRLAMRDAFLLSSELELGFWEAAWRSEDHEPARPPHPRTA